MTIWFEWHIHSKFIQSLLEDLKVFKMEEMESRVLEMELQDTTEDLYSDTQYLL